VGQHVQSGAALAARVEHMALFQESQNRRWLAFAGRLKTHRELDRPSINLQAMEVEPVFLSRSSGREPVSYSCSGFSIKKFTLYRPAVLEFTNQQLVQFFGESIGAFRAYRTGGTLAAQRPDAHLLGGATAVIEECRCRSGSRYGDAGYTHAHAGVMGWTDANTSLVKPAGRLYEV
jgi:hypothetical protein